MSAAELLSLFSQVRPRGEHRWTARCPAHQDRSPSLSICQLADRVLINCFAGCPVTDICTAIGISLADLYIDSRYRRYRPDPLVERRCRAAEALGEWRQAEVCRCAEELRLRDMIILQIDRTVSDGPLTEDEAMISLSYEYDGYSELEYRFDRLLRGEEVLEMWRESRRDA
jgi:hypothetical protein